MSSGHEKVVPPGSSSAWRSGKLAEGSTGADVKLSAAAEARVQEIVSRYPHSKSAVMPMLYVAQEELGWVNDAAIAWVANRLQLPVAHVIEVATFYTMYYKKPVGKYHFQVCRTLSCMLCGAKKVTAQLRKNFGIEAGEVSGDGMWSYEEVECLGSCGTAPMVQVNDVFFENLALSGGSIEDAVDALIEKLKREQPNLRFSERSGLLGEGMPEHPRSQVWPPTSWEGSKS